MFVSKESLTKLFVFWILMPLAAGLVVGSASAFFLVSLDKVTELQTMNGWLLWLLPFGGALVSFIYSRYGQTVTRGNNLAFEQVHNGEGAVPLRMAPLVLFGTLITHLFGGSAGREGTAVQMGSSLSAGLGKLFMLNKEEQRIIVMCGISAGFGSVFGTPMAGLVFGLEVAAKGSLRYKGIFPCLIAAYTGHFVTLGWGVTHGHYDIGDIPSLGWLLLIKVIAAAAMFGFAALLFARLTSFLKQLLAQWLPHPAARSFIGGVVVIALVYAIGSRDYLGLGLPLMEQAFHEAASPLVFLFKTLFTSITLGSGYIGGEVTPLFVIGSTLGSALSPYLSLPIPFLSALGLAAVFGAASKTPLACTVLGLELFGFEGAIYFLIACYISNIISGRYGIYPSHVRYYVPKR